MEDLNSEEKEFSQAVVDEGKTIAIISYLTIIGLIIAFVMNNDKKNQFASFHIRQMVGLALTSIVISFVGVIPFLGWIIAILGSLFILFLWVSGLLNALNGKAKLLPILGKKYEEWFKGI